MRCKDVSVRCKDFNWDVSFSSLLLSNNFSLNQNDFGCLSESTSMCVEMTLYRNERKPLKSVPLHCTYDVMHFGIDTTWRTDDVKESFGFIY